MIDGESMQLTLPAPRAGRPSLSPPSVRPIQFSYCHLDDCGAGSSSSSSSSSNSSSILAAITMLMVRESVSSLPRAMTLPIAIRVASSVALNVKTVA